ncbi:MAG TPA: 50S ribosomal protein L6, partial [Bacteroidota bacterium]
AEMKGKKLQLQLGYSHPILFGPPDGIKIEAPTQTNIMISGIDKQLVGLVAAKIRSFKPPEPYKGKGIKYENEYIRRKAGKAAATAATK